MERLHQRRVDETRHIFGSSPIDFPILIDAFELRVQAHSDLLQWSSSRCFLLEVKLPAR